MLRLTPLTAGLRSRNATASTMSAIRASRPHGIRATTWLRFDLAVDGRQHELVHGVDPLQQGAADAVRP